MIEFMKSNHSSNELWSKIANMVVVAKCRHKWLGYGQEISFNAGCLSLVTKECSSHNEYNMLKANSLLPDTETGDP